MNIMIAGAWDEKNHILLNNARLLAKNLSLDKVATTSPLLDPDLIPAAFLSKNAAGGVLITKSNERSS